ncbi:hypothetical protein BDR04DRAFT_1037931 [Suillus decipiens]|nr:hypothetical protein BDR04DRAFT_1037931 [Suillus decipiens]
MLIGGGRVVTDIITATTETLQLYSDAHFDKQPYHTSALSGMAWVNELLTGHPDCI